MSAEQPSSPSMHDVIAPAFELQASLNTQLADEGLVLDRNVKTRTRKELNRLKAMMQAVLQFQDDVPADVIEGMEEVIMNTEARLDGKPMRFKSDEVSQLDAEPMNQLAA